ncbi:MAG TPA: lysylphosphatidylglycerol synthase domain-containing protein [Vicinamibacterales bacterium]
MTERTRSLITAAAVILGIGLLALTIVNTDFASARRALAPLVPALPLVLLPGLIWHLLRTEAWRQSFPSDTRLPFWRVFRVRLAAEAFSFVTIRGVAGEPLKVIWLGPDVPSMIAAAAVALERIAYLVVTSVCVGLFSAIAILTIPLTRPWLHVFGWLCGVSFAFAAAPFIVAKRTASRSNGPTENGKPRSLLVRFLRQLVSQFDTLLDCDRRRLAALVALEVAAFASMALEVWIILRLTQTPVTMFGAVAMETFTRAASTASAFIPANLGALEASNVAVAVALQAGAGAIVLAVARRIRGLFWCAAGFLIHPRRPRPASSHAGSERTLVTTEDAHPPVRIDARLGGMPIGERICRAAARAGYSRVLIWTPGQKGAWQRIARRVRRRITVIAADDSAQWREWIASAPSSAVTILPPYVIPSPAYLNALDRGGDRARESWSASVTSAESLAIAERRLRESIFKPTDGPLARFNRRLSIPLSVALIRWTRMSAHAMSAFVIALGLFAGWLFSRGTYTMGVLAAIVSLAASVLDGCDGELARLQYKESALGCWIDTLGDYTYYVAIFAGLTIGAVHQTGSAILWWLGTAFGAGVLLTFALLILLRWRATDGHPERLRATTAAHFNATNKPWAATLVWLAGCATRANMPYGIVAIAIADLLPAVVVLGAIGANVYWISLARELRTLMAASKAQTPSIANLPASS